MNKQIQKKTADKSSKKNSSEQREVSKDTNFEDKLKKLCRGLIYISETDAEIFPFIGEVCQEVSADTLLFQIESYTDPIIEENNFGDFFSNLIIKRDWFDRERLKMTENFAELKKLLEENLCDLKVFKLGEIEIDIFVVGLDHDKRLTGIKTKAVET